MIESSTAAMVEERKLRSEFDASTAAAPPTGAPLSASLARYRRIRDRVGRIVPSNYDISDVCNLRCEGCLYFEGADRLSHTDRAADSDWESFFADEADRGVNFAYLAGAEPTLQSGRIKLAQKYIPHGVVFTNGTRKVPDELEYRIHVSIWGAPAQNESLRGADNAVKAIRHYSGDPRAIFVYTISRANITGIFETARMLHDNNCTLTFSYFSPTVTYNQKLYTSSGPDKYFRLSSADDNLVLRDSDFKAARREIEKSIERFGETVKYSLDYDDWITQSDPYVIDEEGVAVNCGNRLTPKHHHFAVDLTKSEGKCCSPNIDCRSCRAYAQGFGSYLTRFSAVRHDAVELERWLSVWELWADLFLPVRRT